VTIRSGQQRVVRFRFACDKALRYVVDQVAFLSLGKSEWARAYYDQQRSAGPRSSSGSAGVGRQVVEDHLRDVGPSNPVRRAALSGDDDATAAAAAGSEKSRLTWTRETRRQPPGFPTHPWPKGRAVLCSIASKAVLLLWESWFSAGIGDSCIALGSQTSQWPCNRASES
jgi:hypothetical protein